MDSNPGGPDQLPDAVGNGHGQPSAIDTAPATNPAIPAVRIGPGSGVTAATPTTKPAVQTMPSLAPSIPARSQFSRCPKPPACGSAE